MESTVSNAFLLLLVGMITVFVILALVVATGKLLIQLTNSMYKEPETVIEDGMNPKHIALLSAVVEHVTAGQGSLQSIEKH